MPGGAYSPTRAWLRREQGRFHGLAVQERWYDEPPARGGSSGDYTHEVRYTGMIRFVGPDQAFQRWVDSLGWRLEAALRASSAERRDR